MFNCLLTKPNVEGFVDKRSGYKILSIKSVIAKYGGTYPVAGLNIFPFFARHFLARSLPSEFLKLANQEEGLHLAAFLFLPFRLLVYVRRHLVSNKERLRRRLAVTLMVLLITKSPILWTIVVLSVCWTLLRWFHWLNVPSSYTTLEQLSCLAKLPL